MALPTAIIGQLVPFLVLTLEPTGLEPVTPTLQTWCSPN
jgi:hypothetical protein